MSVAGLVLPSSAYSSFATLMKYQIDSLSCGTQFCTISNYTSDTKTILENFFFRIAQPNSEYTLRVPLSML